MPKEFVSATELATLTGTPESTIKYYSDEGLIPYIKYGGKSSKNDKRYPLNDAKSSIKHIFRLQSKGYNIAMIKESFGYDLFEPVHREKNNLEKLIIQKTMQYLPKLEIEFIKCIATENYIQSYWDGKPIPKNVIVSCHIKSNVGNASFYDFVSKQEKASSCIWGILYKIGKELGLNTFDEKYNQIWDKSVREELNAIGGTTWELINVKNENTA